MFESLEAVRKMFHNYKRGIINKRVFKNEARIQILLLSNAVREYNKMIQMLEMYVLAINNGKEDMID